MICTRLLTLDTPAFVQCCIYCSPEVDTVREDYDVTQPMIAKNVGKIGLSRSCKTQAAGVFSQHAAVNRGV